MKKKIFFVFLLLVFLIRPLQVLYEQKDVFFSRTYQARYEQLRKLYYSSQYVKKDKPSIIPDEALEAFAGGAFLHGINPILIVHDQPPLGRYITAFSILLFDNPNTLVLILLFLSAVCIFLISLEVLDDIVFALIPAGIFLNEPIFLSKLHYTPLLETIQLPFIFFCIYFFIKAIKRRKKMRWFFLTSLMLGFVISIRFFVLGGALFLAMLLYLFLFQREKKLFIQFFLTLPLSIFVLIASYVKTIQDGASIIHIFGIQRYILEYHKSKFVLPFTFWDLLFFNRWHTWWGSYAISSDSEWILLWPIAVSLSILSAVFGFIKKIKLNEAEKIILLWVAGYCLMLSTGYTSTRYFLPFIPFLYIIGLSFLVKVVQKYAK